MGPSLEQALHVPLLDLTDERQRSHGLRWLDNLLCTKGVAWGLPEPRVLVSDMHAVRLVRLAAFWDELGPSSLTQRIGEVLGSLSRVARRLLVVVSRRRGELVWIAAADIPARTLEGLLAGALPGSQVSTDLGHGADIARLLAPRGRLALVGVPPRVAAPREVPLVERLARCDVEQWTLLSQVQVVPPALLQERYDNLAQLGRACTTASRATRVLSEVETRDDVDPLATQLAELVGLEQRRARRALQQQGLAAQTWLLAEPSEVSVLGAVAAGALRPAASTPRPLRVVADTGRMPATSLLLPDELSMIVQPPVHDVAGFEVVDWARFDLVARHPDGETGPSILLGEVPEAGQVRYPAAALTDHALICGATGAGKSSLLRSLLGQLARSPHQVPLLVIEPTKDEYATLPIAGLQVWRIGAPTDSWRLNPLEVPYGIPVQTHIDLIIALFESSFALVPPLPYLLEMGLRAVYEHRGWDLAASRNAYAEADPDFPAFPTLRELQATCLDLVDELGYQGEVRHNVRGALQARLGSLLAGAKGALLDTDAALDTDRLFEHPCVVNLDLVGSEREKAFFMGLLLIRLWEARRGARHRGLRHVTVLEEAHRILPATRAAAGDVWGGTADFAAETFTNLLSEVRSAGEGIMVVEQSPSTLAHGALTNTGLKIAMRTMQADDRQLIAAGCNLDQAAQQALTSFAPHDAVVFWAGMDQAARIRATAEFPPEGEAPTSVPNAPAVPVLADPQAQRLAELLVRVAPDETRIVRDELIDRISCQLPAALQQRATDVADRLVVAAAEQLGRQLLLGPAARRTLAAVAIGASDAHEVLDQRSRTCTCVREAATRCLYRGFAANALASWQQCEPRPVAALDLLGPDDAAQLLRDYASTALGTDRAPRALSATAGCLARQVLSATRPPAQVRAELARLNLL